MVDYVRMHPERFFPVMGNGLEYNDCIYQMLQVIVDNSIDEFKCGYGNRVELTADFDSGRMSVRDYGCGAPVSKLEQCFGVHAVGSMYTILPNYSVVEELVVRRIRNCATANPGMTFVFDGRVIKASEPKSDIASHD